MAAHSPPKSATAEAFFKGMSAFWQFLANPLTVSNWP
jgi:hypothetical protein